MTHKYKFLLDLPFHPPFEFWAENEEEALELLACALKRTEDVYPPIKEPA